MQTRVRATRPHALGDRWRQMLALLAAFALVSVVVACSDDGADTAAADDSDDEINDDGYDFPDLSGESMVFVDYGGPTSEVLAEVITQPFSRGTGAEVLHDSPFDPAQLKAQVDAGNVSWDLVNGDPLIAIAFCRDGLLEELDPSILEDVKPEYETGGCVLPINVYASVLAYDNTVFDEDPPTSWADFFDTEKYPGKRGMWSFPALNQIEIALLADGVAPEDLYPLDLDRAFAKLDTIKDDIVFFDSFAQVGEQMHSRAVVMSDVPSPRGMRAASEGAPFVPVWNQAFLAWEGYGIPKGSSNVETASALLRYMATADVQGRVAGPLGLAPTTSQEVDLSGLTDHELAWLPAGDNIAKAVTVDPDWWADHYDEAVARFVEWTAG